MIRFSKGRAEEDDEVEKSKMSDRQVRRRKKEEGELKEQEEVERRVSRIREKEEVINVCLCP